MQRWMNVSLGSSLCSEETTIQETGSASMNSSCRVLLFYYVAWGWQVFGDDAEARGLPHGFDDSEKTKKVPRFPWNLKNSVLGQLSGGISCNRNSVWDRSASFHPFKSSSNLQSLGELNSELIAVVSLDSKFEAVKICMAHLASEQELLCEWKSFLRQTALTEVKRW